MEHRTLMQRAAKLMASKAGVCIAIVPLAEVPSTALAANDVTLHPSLSVVYFSGLWQPPGTITVGTSNANHQVDVAGSFEPIDGTTWTAHQINIAGVGFFTRGEDTAVIPAGVCFSINYDIDVHLTSGNATLLVAGDFVQGISLDARRTFSISADSHLSGSFQGLANGPGAADTWFFYALITNWTNYQPTDQLSMNIASQGLHLSIGAVPEPANASILCLGAVSILLKRRRRVL